AAPRLTARRWSANFYLLVSRFPVAAGEHTAWLLELGATARADAQRPVLCRGLAAWSSRRARANARREMIRERIEAAAMVVVLDEPETIDEHLLERISVYTHAEDAPALALGGAQPALTASLRSTVTGPGFAAPTVHTVNR